MLGVIVDYGCNVLQVEGNVSIVVDTMLLVDIVESRWKTILKDVPEGVELEG